ncbi:MAG: glycosyltransferase [Acidobacteriota bacterium]
MTSRNESLPPVSVLICTKDRRQDLQRALVSLQKLDYPRDKLDIVVIEETDAPRAPDGVRYVVLPVENRGFGHARRVAVDNAQHDLLLFTDDDCVVEPNWATELVRCFEPDVGGVAGAVLVEPTNVLGYCENILGFPGGGLKYFYRAAGKPYDTSLLSTCNCAYRRKAVQEAGGFSIDTTYGGEDYHLARRVASRYRCRYTPSAVVYHKPRGTWRGIARWFVRRGNAEIELAQFTDAPGRHLWNAAKSSMIIRVAALLGLLLAMGWASWPVLLILAALYYIAMLQRHLYGLRYYRRLDIWLTVPFVKLTMDVSMDCGRLEAFLARRWRRPEPSST